MRDGVGVWRAKLFPITLMLDDVGRTSQVLLPTLYLVSQLLSQLVSQSVSKLLSQLVDCFVARRICQETACLLRSNRLLQLLDVCWISLGYGATCGTDQGSCKKKFEPTLMAGELCGACS